MDWVRLVVGIEYWGGACFGGSRRQRGVREGYFCLSYFGVGGDVAVVLLGDLGFRLAEVFAGRVEGGFGHGCSSGSLDELLKDEVGPSDYVG